MAKFDDSAGQSSALPMGDLNKIETLSRELELLRIKLDKNERVNDPGIVVSRTSNLLSFLTFIVVLLGVTGGTGLYIQGRQADQLNTQSDQLNSRLDGFRTELGDIVNRSFAYMDRQLAPIEKAVDQQQRALNERFATLETDLRNKYESDNIERAVSLSVQDRVIYFRESSEGFCTGHVVFLVTNNTPYLTEMVQTQQYTRRPLVAGNLSRLTDWDDVTTTGLLNESYRMLVGNDVRPWYVAISIGRPYWSELASTWTPEARYPLKFVLSYLRRGSETASISIDENLTIDQSLIDCVRQRLGVAQ